MNHPPHIFDMLPDQLDSLVTELEMPAFRATQLMDWIYKHKIADPGRMDNISKPDRQKLAQHIQFIQGSISRHQQASDGTQKLLLQWSGAPSDQSECVMIPATESSPRFTACLSSQVGCPVQCRFCASGLNGLDRNLSTGQIVEQLWHLSALPQIDRITNVVFMGIGEPLTNFQNVIQAVKMITADWAFNISARKITISTVGLPAQIRKLAEIDLPVTLAISLHAPHDDLRRQLIPWAEYIKIDEVIDAAKFYFDRTGREITLEYILLHHVNDLPKHARLLIELARKLRCNVNLIRYNEVALLPYRRPDDASVKRFTDQLRYAGINTHLRASRGRDIAAACGQLRHTTP